MSPHAPDAMGPAEGVSSPVTPTPAAPLASPASAPSSVAEEYASGAREVRVIFTDVDGTLLDPEQRLKPRVRLAVAAAAAAGVPLVVATGKGPHGPWVDRVVPHLRLTLPRIHTQGLVVVEAPLDGAVIRSRWLDARTASVAARAAVALGADPVLYLPEGCAMRQHSNLSDRLLEFFGEKCTGAVPDMLERLDAKELRANKVVAMCRSETTEEVRRGIVDVLTAQDLPFEITCAVPGMLEILPVGCSKGEAVAWLLRERLNVAPEHAMALGDGENDVEMLRHVGLGVAMGNAVQQAVDAADATTATNADDGVAEAIAKYVLVPRGIPAPWDVPGCDLGETY